MRAQGSRACGRVFEPDGRRMSLLLCLFSPTASFSLTNRVCGVAGDSGLLWRTSTRVEGKSLLASTGD